MRTSSKARRSSRSRRRGDRRTSGGRSSSTRGTCTRRSSSRTSTGKILDYDYIPERALHRSSAKGQQVIAGHAAGQEPPRGQSGTQDITGGLPRVTELFEARKPKEPGPHRRDRRDRAQFAEKKRGKRTIYIVRWTRADCRCARRSRAHRSARQACRCGCTTGDRVKAGDAAGRAGRWCRTTSSGSPAKRRCSSTCSDEIQNVYRVPARRDRRQAHRDHRRADAPQGAVEQASATPACCRGCVIDKFEFRGRSTTELVKECVKVKNKGESAKFRRRPDRAQATCSSEENGPSWRRATARRCRPSTKAPDKATAMRCSCSGITKAAVQSESLHLGRVLPGDDQGADRGGPGGQGGPTWWA